ARESRCGAQYDPARALRGRGRRGAGRCVPALRRRRLHHRSRYPGGRRPGDVTRSRARRINPIAFCQTRIALKALCPDMIIDHCDTAVVTSMSEQSASFFFETDAPQASRELAELRTTGNYEPPFEVVRRRVI